MKTINLRIFLLSLFALTLFSCAEDNEVSGVFDNDLGVIGTRTESKFDKYLEREYLDPYNIRLEYRLDDVQTNFDYNVVPVKEEQAIKLARLIKYLCLEPYELNTEANFLQKYFPKTIVLVGSGAFNGNGTFLLGTAQGGVKIMLYRVNDVDTTNPQILLEWYFNTIFHEFSHILHQNKKFSKDFEKISKTDYVGDEWSKYWFNKDNPEETKDRPKSYEKGFISNYSSNTIEDDFVEIIAHYVTLTTEQWNNTINPNGDNKEGVARMNQKLAIVKGYLEESWNIDIDKLRAEVQKRLKNVKNFDATNIE